MKIEIFVLFILRVRYVPARIRPIGWGSRFSKAPKIRDGVAAPGGCKVCKVLCPRLLGILID